MCLAVPVQVETIEGEQGTVSLEGTRAQVLLALVPGVKVGDWVLVHAGMAITILDEAEARKTYELLAEMGAAMQDGGAGGAA